MASGSTSTYSFPYPVDSDPVDVAGDIKLLALSLDSNLSEIAQDAVALSLINGTYGNGLGTPSYNDIAGTVSWSLTQDLQTTASPTFAGASIDSVRIGVTTANEIDTSSGNLILDSATGTTQIDDALTVTGQITSNVTNGTAPLVITSTTAVTNLNADLLDGQHGSYYTTAGNLSGTIPSSVLGNSTVYIGTTSIALNRTSASQSLTGITSIDGSAATLTTGRTIGMTGDVSWTSASFNGSGNVTGTSTIQNSAVTYAKIQNVSATNRILGRITAGAGVVEELTAANVMTILNGSTTALDADSGGTGQTAYTIGDILYASSTTALSKLAGVATGNALISGGVGTAPSWGKIGLTTHISGTLAVGNGGTGLATTPTNGQLLIGNGTNYTLATLTQGTGMTITNGSGSISLAVASVPNSQVIKFDTGTTEGTDLYTFNGSASKTIDIKAGTNITLTKSAGSITINSSAGGGTTTNSLTMKFDSGTTEGTDLYTFNGSTTKTIDFVAGANITLTKAAGQITVASTASGNAGLQDVLMFAGM